MAHSFRNRNGDTIPATIASLAKNLIPHPTTTAFLRERLFRMGAHDLFRTRFLG